MSKFYHDAEDNNAKAIAIPQLFSKKSRGKNDNSIFVHFSALDLLKRPSQNDH